MLLKRTDQKWSRPQKPEPDPEAEKLSQIADQLQMLSDTSKAGKSLEEASAGQGQAEIKQTVLGNAERPGDESLMPDEMTETEKQIIALRIDVKANGQELRRILSRLRKIEKRLRS